MNDRRYSTRLLARVGGGELSTADQTHCGPRVAQPQSNTCNGLVLFMKFGRGASNDWQFTYR